MPRGNHYPGVVTVPGSCKQALRISYLKQSCFSHREGSVKDKAFDEKPVKTLTKAEMLNEAREKRLKGDLSPREEKQNLWEKRINTWDDDLLI